MKRFSNFLIFAAVSAALPLAASVDGVGSSGGSLLTIQTGVRPAGMGNAFVGVANDINALYYNPAGLGTLRNVEFTALQQNLASDTTYRNAALAISMGEVTSSNVSQFGTVALSFGILDFGKIQGRDNLGNTTPDFKANDTVWTLGYGKGFFDTIFVGAAYKRMDQRISDIRASNSAFDLGLLYRLSSEWKIGLSGRNLGGDINFSSAEEPLPRTTTLGFGYTPFKDALTFSLDIEKPRETENFAKGGVEWLINRTIALRSGYNSGTGPNGGFSFGVGLCFMDFETLWFPVQRLSIDYAFLPSSTVSGVDGDAVGSRQNISLTMRFGDR